jgi:hypothetical protein
MDDLEEIGAVRTEIVRIGLDTLKALNRRRVNRNIRDGREEHERIRIAQCRAIIDGCSQLNKMLESLGKDTISQRLAELERKAAILYTK